MKRNIAVIGCGYWGQNLVRNFHELNSLYAVCDHDSKVADKFADLYNVKSINLNELLVDKNIDGVVIASPVEFHAELAISVIKAKKHVFIEKPIASNIDEAEEIIRIAKENNISVMVGHLLQYHPAFKRLAVLVNENKVGKLHYISSTRKSFGKIRKFEDVIWSFAPHDISMILKLAHKSPLTIKCNSSSFMQEDISDVASVHLYFADNLRADINVSWIHPEKEQKLIVIGSKGMLVFDDVKPWDEKLAFYSYKISKQNGSIIHSKKDVEFIKVKDDEPLKNECKHFLKVVGGENPITNGEEGLSVLRVLSKTLKK